MGQFSTFVCPRVRSWGKDRWAGWGGRRGETRKRFLKHKANFVVSVVYELQPAPFLFSVIPPPSPPPPPHPRKTACVVQRLLLPPVSELLGRRVAEVKNTAKAIYGVLNQINTPAPSIRASELRCYLVWLSSWGSERIRGVDLASCEANRKQVIKRAVMQKAVKFFFPLALKKLIPSWRCLSHRYAQNGTQIRPCLGDNYTLTLSISILYHWCSCR